jgi:hypothetical protein
MSVSSGVKYTVIDRKFNVADELIQAMELQALQQRVSYSNRAALWVRNYGSVVTVVIE